MDSASSTITAFASASGLAAAHHGSSSNNWMATLGQALLGLAKLMPALLLWLITFTTITLPTLLFTLFSTSLTFTMNATTLYVAAPKANDRSIDILQTLDCFSVCVHHILDRPIPISEHVRSVTARTSTKGTRDRPYPGYARRRLQTWLGELSGRVPKRYQGVWIS